MYSPTLIAGGSIYEHFTHAVIFVPVIRVQFGKHTCPESTPDGLIPSAAFPGSHCSPTLTIPSPQYGLPPPPPHPPPPQQFTQPVFGHTDA